jgi:hypothetical protein
MVCRGAAVRSSALSQNVDPQRFLPSSLTERRPWSAMMQTLDFLVGFGVIAVLAGIVYLMLKVSGTLR